jgi:hypothetical protein
VLDVTPGIFEEEQAESDRRGGTLALAPLASSSQEFEERACSGEFDQAPITFRDADGKPTALRPDIEALRDQAAELKRNGPVHRRPSHPIEIFRADELEVTAKAVVAEDEEPETQMLADHPRVYKVAKLHPYKPRVHHYSKEERNIGTGREGVGEGPDPSKFGRTLAFGFRSVDHVQDHDAAKVRRGGQTADFCDTIPLEADMQRASWNVR